MWVRLPPLAPQRKSQCLAGLPALGNLKEFLFLFDGHVVLGKDILGQRYASQTRKEEGMPSTKGLEVFVRKNQLADEEWFGLIEARRELIKPHLDSFTLPELGMLECMQSEGINHALSLDISTSTGDPRFSLKTQGLFRMQAWSAVERIPNSGYRPADFSCPDGTMRVWGLTRSGLWVLVTIGFLGEGGYKGRGYERARTVEIVETDLPTIATKTKERPQRMWQQLGEVVRGFAEHRKFLYNQALNLARIVEIEELAFSLIPEEA